MLNRAIGMKPWQNIGGRPMNSIYDKANPAIEKVFEEAGARKKVMCVAFDYAKKSHTALVCNGAGMQLRGAFDVHNTPEGLEYLDKVVRGLCRKHHIKKEFVIFGGEDCGSYAFNFIHALAAKGKMVIGVNAKDAKDERGNVLASTDKKDPLGVAAMILKGRGRTIRSDTSDMEILRRLNRQRQSLIKSRTASANRIHRLVDQLLPGFLDNEKSGLSPFSRASLWLMSERFSAKQIHSRKLSTLVNRFRSFSVHNAEQTARQLKSLAEEILPPPPAMIPCLQESLSHEVITYRTLTQSIQDLEKVIARHCAATQGAMLTTMQAIGIGLASGLYAEIADPSRRKALYRMASYAGLVNRLKQTGGPDKEARSTGRSRRCNMFLKTLLVDLVIHIGQAGSSDLKSDYFRRGEQGQYHRLTMARKMLRICAHLMDGDFYLPSELRENPSHEALREYYQNVWNSILVKWRNAGAIKQAFAKDAPLEQWRCMINERYDLNLSNISPQAWQLRKR
jgi:transposase